MEEELAEIAGIQDDLTKFERLVAWSAVHPDEVLFAVRFFSGRSKGLEKWIERHSKADPLQSKAEPIHSDDDQL